MNGKGLQDLTGKVFGRLTVLHRAPKGAHKFKGARWVCQCTCGTVKEVFGFVLKDGTTQSCGCYRLEYLRTRPYPKKHGLHNTKAYHAWESIKQRCLNPSNPMYGYYGGRGITIDKEFVDSFESFAAEVGPCPSRKHQVDRIDNTKGYEPGNLRWATRAEQMRNTRRNRFFTYH